MQVDWQLKVYQDYSTSLTPEKDETWETLYKRLKIEIFENGGSLHAAAELGCEQALERILTARLGNVNGLKYGMTPLHYAAAAKVANAKAVEILIEHGADLTVKYYESLTAVDFAVQARHSSIYRLLDPQKNLSVDLLRSLIKSDEAKDEETLQKLLEFGLNLNEVDSSGRSCLHHLLWSVTNRSVSKKVKWLIDHGANANLADNEGVTPLHLACLKRDLSSAEVLSAHGAKAMPDSHGDTPLHWYLWKGIPEDIWQEDQSEYKHLFTIYSIKALTWSAFLASKVVKFCHLLNDCCQKKKVE